MYVQEAEKQDEKVQQMKAKSLCLSSYFIHGLDFSPKVLNKP